MSKKPKIVIAGNGFAGLTAALILRQRLGSAVSIELVGTRPILHFYPLATYIPFGLSQRNVDIPLKDLLHKYAIDWVSGKVVGVDPGRQILKTRSGEVEFDRLILALGAGSAGSAPLDAVRNAFNIARSDGLQKLGRFLGSVLADRDGAQQTLTFVAQRSGGCSLPLFRLGILSDLWLSDLTVRDRVKLELLTFEREPLAHLGTVVSKTMNKKLSAASIRVFTNFTVKGYVDGVLEDRIGKIHRPGQLVTIGPPKYAGNSLPGLPLDRHGFVSTDPSTCQVIGHDTIFSVGDSAGLSASRCVFVAMHQAAAAATTIAHQFDAQQEQKKFIPCMVTSVETKDQDLYFRSLAAEPDRDEEMLEPEMVSASLRELFSWLWPTRVLNYVPSSGSIPISLIEESILSLEPVLP